MVNVLMRGHHLIPIQPVIGKIANEFASIPAVRALDHHAAPLLVMISVLKITRDCSIAHQSMLTVYVDSRFRGNDKS